MNGCAMYSLFTYSGTLGAWKVRYCTADYLRCARYQRATVNQHVPVNLMPNGVLLQKLAANG